MDLRKIIESSFERRIKGLETLKHSHTNCFRAFGGQPEGIAGLTLDVFARVGILNFYEGKCPLKNEELKKLAEIAQDIYSLDSIYLKTFVSHRSHKELSSKLLEATAFVGEKSPETVLVNENGVVFEIHPYDGYSVGLFLDQRENRKIIGDLSSGKRVLNLFAYTCGFSVAAAMKGGETVSVDTSKKYLEWGKRNFIANHLSLQKHKFLEEDVGVYLRRLHKRKESFGVLVLDPPSFGRSQKGVFSLEKDLNELLDLSLQLLDENGTLLLSCNYQKWTEKNLKAFLKDALKRNKLTSKAITSPTPFDFQLEENPLAQELCILSA